MELVISRHHVISKNFGLNIQEFDLNCCLPSYNSTSTYVVAFFTLCQLFLGN
jgi:hypothetical protein